MPTREWIFLSNTFEVQTRDSNRKALSLFTDTDAKLSNEMADPDILICYNLLHPAFTSYQDIYAQKQMVSGTYEGKTAKFEEILADLKVQVKVWEGKTRAEFPEDSPTDIEIWPDKRAPFNSGEYEERIAAVEALANKLLEFPALAATQLLVQSFYNSAEGARLVQQQTEGSSGQLSDLLENQRNITCIAMYGVLGYLMYKFRATPDQVARFFDLSLLRSTGGDDENVLLDESIDIAANTTVNVPITAFTMHGEYNIEVTNPVDSAAIGIGFGPNATTTPDPDNVDAGTFLSATAFEIGFDVTDTFLNIVNATGAPATISLKVRKD